MRKSTLRIAAIGVAALALVGFSATAASAAVSPTAPKPANSFGNFYIADGGDTGDVLAPGTELEFDYQAVGRPDNTAAGVDNHFPASAEVAETVTTFIAPIGQELTPAAWLTTGTTGFFPGNKEVWLPNVALSGFTLPGTSSIDTIKASGGDFSLGFAYQKTNGLYVVQDGAYFTHITVQPGTGSWTFETPSGDTPPPVDPTLTGDVDLEATTIAGPPPVDGTLNLTVPAAAKVTFNAATLVDGLSTSTGALPNVTVQDDRNASKPGWKLTASVNDFAGPSATIEKKQLGMVPTIVSGTTGAVVGATQVAGSAAWNGTTVASAPAAAGTGTTVVGANLTFVAPADKPVGTYTSKMTLTLVSE
ncbi:hypothetical protein [Herbiconiux sp. VKM Ac-2851]|uniref:hypothetical protein n=1 Tax=Herbiconiux sp. VKM Ac-2851 TaxID=2739025 RepID=UPI001564CDA3|nr:hypothetical protein [Herbiconiux sp. VKM Ac-2851]NQX36545.1 hypothetical protein [Herbiconiux sp. VKM Ac-2851]